jgi:hypothetical protein
MANGRILDSIQNVTIRFKNKSRKHKFRGKFGVHLPYFTINRFLDDFLCKFQKFISCLSLTTVAKKLTYRYRYKYWNS